MQAPALFRSLAGTTWARIPPLWESYNIHAALISKTYAPGGTSSPTNAGPFDRPAVHDAQEYPMLDIVMLALGFGFFAAGIGYAYACERL